MKRQVFSFRPSRLARIYWMITFAFVPSVVVLLSWANFPPFRFLLVIPGSYLIYALFFRPRYMAVTQAGLTIFYRLRRLRIPAASLVRAKVVPGDEVNVPFGVVAYRRLTKGVHVEGLG
ncbi:MAG: hypothetical protein ACE15C_17300 [Phycisphaerae bacterium]